ncbi:MAG: phosphate ABC transporter permease PstA [Akkermansia sp.]|nr:phosphate ABC transporter permease PstA [Akkermansia sp.]
MKKRSAIFRKAGNQLLNLAAVLSIALALGGMGWILATVFSHGWSALSLDFLTSVSKPYGEPGGGVANALLGTLLMTLGATVLAVPPALAGGIYLAEFGKGSKVADALRFCANVMMGLPSILVGLFVYALLVVPTGNFSGLAGTVALAIIMFPVVLRTTEDMLLMVPDTLRESALALGMSRMRATLCIVARSARNGLATGILLSLARVSGETAPLLFTALFADSWPEDFFTGPTASAPVLITEYTTNSPFESMHAMGWGAALVMAAFILIINIATRCIFHENKH